MSKLGYTGINPAFGRGFSFAGLTLDRPRLMGIVNVTPDSFSDGGQFLETQAAIDHGLSLLDTGADILDVGGESTRPGARPVGEAEEADRVLPVIEALAKAGACVSADTRHAAVMRAAVQAGATVINDVTALEGAGSVDAAADTGASVVLMHMQGEPGTMQDAPAYDDVVADVRAYLAARIDACVAAGIDKSRIAVDPGIGFGKTAEHNAHLIRHLEALQDLGVAVLLGVSRKSFIAHVSKGEAAEDRLAGSIAAHLAGLQAGAHILRVHDVAETAQALAVWAAVFKA